MSMEDFRALSAQWLEASLPERYSYNFTWMGRPIIQYPQDIVALQELIWRIRPQVVLETGIAHGGSLVFSASMLHLLGGEGRVIGIDIDIRSDNRIALDEHPMRSRIDLVEGSSISPETVKQIHEMVGGRSPLLLILDSNHTHAHVLQELRAYSGLVGAGSYVVVLDTVVEVLPGHTYPDRPWGPGNSPGSAVEAFLAENDRFEVDSELESRIAITTAPGGYLRCIRD
ncbi:MAG TPA: CmcI family methyltransferase [Nocardioides sp.]|uniref:cephalosporin hydroxylase family protein n=1 Tax=Nocardioides sp. TaxID=35761 RepID=UPI002F3F8EBB